MGIARLSQDIKAQEGDTGSPAYMAPERFYGQFSAASDLYSVGILLFELLTGYRPFSGTPAELRSAHLNRALQMPDSLPLVWRSIIAKALQKLPGRRFHSAAEMLKALRLAQAERPENPAPPLFFTVTEPPACRFEPTGQQPLEQKIIHLAAIPTQRPSGEQPQGASSAVCFWRATAIRLDGWTGWTEQAGVNRAPQPIQRASYPLSAPIERLLARPQGCFVVTRRTVGWVSLEQPDVEAGLQQISGWQQDRIAAIDPKGNWIALLRQEAPIYHLTFQPLPQALAQMTLASAVTGCQQNRLVEMLALDSRHLALFWKAQGAEQSTAELLSRRGNRLGTLDLPLGLQQISLTPKPYRLLATDAYPGTVLLLDLKPYRIRRLWVEISPQFLLATDWGYILAETGGTLVFLDQAGQPIGRLSSPLPITALTLWENQLWIATWSSGRGRLYALDLHHLGLDLVF